MNPITESTNSNGHDRAGGRAATNRAAVNKANAQHSTGPRTEAGKQRSKLNAFRHGLTGQTVVLPTSLTNRISSNVGDAIRVEGPNLCLGRESCLPRYSR